MFKRFVTLAAILFVGVLIAACAQSTGGDPYEDPDTSPPPEITDPTVATSASFSAAAGSSDLWNINVAGFADPNTGDPVTGLNEDDFTVVVDGNVEGITVEAIGSSSLGTTQTAKADIAFVFDTTSSMGSGLDSVQNSIVAFTDFLAGSGLDVQVGAVTFGDAFDTKASGSTRTGVSLQGETPPSFDSSERPTFPLTSDFPSFKTFIEGDSPRAGNDFPENALGSLEFAFDRSDFGWRTGAQRILIVITDVCSHTADTYTQANIVAPWIPSTYADVFAKLEGNATVHVISPSGLDCAASGTLDMADFTGASATGGVYFDWDGNSEFDLTTLPIASVTASGYVITYRDPATSSSHTIRVVIGTPTTDIRGELTIEATY